MTMEWEKGVTAVAVIWIWEQDTKAKAKHTVIYHITPVCNEYYACVLLFAVGLPRKKVNYAKKAADDVDDDTTTTTSVCDVYT